jgi:hypothetical protein
LCPYQWVCITFGNALRAGSDGTPDKSAELPDVAYLFAKFIYRGSYHKFTKYNVKTNELMRLTTKPVCSYNNRQIRPFA